jgi:hypothetical protein
MSRRRPAESAPWWERSELIHDVLRPFWLILGKKWWTRLLMLFVVAAVVAWLWVNAANGPTRCPDGSLPHNYDGTMECG